MPYYKRHIDQKLLEWKDAPRRKPLLIRGARQVGKSTAVRELGKTFKYYVEINLERQQSLRTLFTEDIDVKKTCSNLSATLSIPIVPGEIAERGYTIGNIEESFPAEHLTQPEKFKSLLFYYGMLTISGRMGAVLKLGIPNNNVRRQYYDYLLEEYRNIHPLPTYELDIPYYEAAVNGNWQVMLNQMMKMYSENTSVRSLIEGERNVQGFMNALLNLNPYYLTAPEVELNHGYCDFFLMPDLTRYPMIEHSYILKLKYLKTDASDGEAQNQWTEAVNQIKHYAEGPKIRLMIQDTQLHLIVVQILVYKLEKMEEI